MNALHFPLSKITFSFVLGILVYQCIKITLFQSWLFLAICFLLFFIVYFFVKKQRIITNYFGVITLVLAFSIGINTVSIHNQKNIKNHYCNQILDSENHLIELVIQEKLKNSDYGDRFVAIVKRVDTEKSSGKIALTVYKDSLKRDYIIGQQLQFITKIVNQKKPQNPDQFDYGTYLEKKSIYAQVYVAPSTIKINSVLIKDAWFYADLFRTKIKKQLENNHFGKDELAVAMALLLGQRQEISSEINTNYQLSGAVHILAVSGLHIGLLLFFITFLLRLLPNKKYTSWVKLGITLTFLWLFAFVSGLSPSVIRSVTMFSFIAIGIHLNRKTNIYNTLLVSMFLILLFQPSFIFDVGFQLSYMAVFSIVWIQPLLSGIWKPKNKIVNYFWDILTVSFAAQIGVFPLSIYYFHQFPGLFFVTNMLVIPLVTLIMFYGLLILFIGSVTTIPVIMSVVLEKLITLMNLIIYWIASFERFIIRDISLNLYLMLTLYLVLFSILFWFKKPKFKKLLLALVAVLIFQFTYFYTTWNYTQKSELVVFNLKRSTLISEKTNDKVTLYSSDSILKTIKTNKTLKPYLIANFAKIKSKKLLENVLFYNGKKIIIIDSLGIIPKNCDADIWLIIQSPKINLDRLIKQFKPKQVVVDGSNYKSYANVWKATCEKEKIPFHYTAEKGFYRIR